MTIGSIFITIISITAIAALAASVRIVKQYEKGLILRLGKYRSTANSGLTFIFPFIETLQTTDMREKVINVPPQDVITKDNVGVTVDAVIYYKVVDPVKAEFEVENFDYAATTLAQTNLRNIIGDKLLDDTLTARDIINVDLRQVLDEATDSWGVKVTRVEVQKIDPPTDITHAMSQQMKAEREKRASILHAEGFKQSQILEAEGVRQKDILEAEGAAQARVLRANAEAEAVKQVAEAAEKYFTPRAELLRKLEVSEVVLQGSTKWVLPQDSSLINVLNLSDKEGAITPVPLRSNQNTSTPTPENL
ncbi:SPFH/Band 7/PHB domain protein [candidate division WWE3 bacterium CG_4_10_14_0_2_um_filter_41_14]|uniref:SPFH/Band 7/PHB domain protein n=1 Tax=candidate division WWE3 bacterium CG_4_10_14_0_2_um_filter_41_14 TaxID=1975072 RepID=A0A2M7TGW2_UNCKA|nr:MAG: SPFH/Band 7/PHB domain protein [candidate division WWE3 bacterium CG_4_10_14_0_2_um_filter_41_14]